MFLKINKMCKVRCVSRYASLIHDMLAEHKGPHEASCHQIGR